MNGIMSAIKTFALLLAIAEGERENMVIGLAAYHYINNDILFNLSQMELAVKNAQGKADLLCFGEAFLQGFDAMNWEYSHDREVAVTQDSGMIQSICDMTNQYGIDLLFGYLEREGDLLYSSCMVVEAGRILHNYRRISKGWKDDRITDGHYCEGNVTSDFVYKGRNFRIALCGDMWDDPERFVTDAVLLWPVCCNFSPDEWENEYKAEYLEKARSAAEKTLFVDAIDHQADCLHAAFCFECGRIAAELPSDTEDILYVEV